MEAIKKIVMFPYKQWSNDSDDDPNWNEYDTELSESIEEEPPSELTSANNVTSSSRYDYVFDVRPATSNQSIKMSLSTSSEFSVLEDFRWPRNLSVQ